MRVLPMRALVPGGDRQQVEVVIAEHRDRGVAQRLDLAQHGERVGTAIDEIADEPQPVRRAARSRSAPAAGRTRRGSPGCRRSRRGSWCGNRAARRCARRLSGARMSGLLEFATNSNIGPPRGRRPAMSFPLNPAQREAVRYVDGPLLVLAGAGSGKTRVITAKIAHLIDRGHDPKRIAAITFTNKAAREMRERVTRLLPTKVGASKAAALTISTFHALGLAIVRGDARALGLAPRFSILDPGDLEPVVAEILPTTDLARARAALRTISQWKGAGVSPAVAVKKANDDDELAFARAYARYDETLRAYQAVDFDDLIALPIELLSQQRRGGREVAGALRAPAGRRVPGHESRAVPAAAAALGRTRDVHRGRRRRPGDLRLARRDARQSRAAAAGLSESQGDQARAELPLDGAHPALGQRADRQQREALRQEALERAADRRHDPRDAGAGRRGRGRIGRAAAARAQVRASRPVRRLRDPLSRQSPGEAVRAAAARAERALRHLGRAVVFRPRGDPRPRRVPAADRQRRRRPRIHPRGDDAEAGRRRDVAGTTRQHRADPRRVPVRGRAQRRGAREPAWRGHARSSNRSAR